MANWRDTILKNFKPKISRLTLVADPDGLLTEEGMLSAIKDRGFDLIPFDDPIAFRFAYESFITMPSPLNIILWNGVVRGESGFWQGNYSLFDPDQNIQFQYIPGRQDLVAKYEQAWPMERFRWASEGYFVVEPRGDELLLHDLRFGQSDGGLFGDGSYIFSYTLNENPATGEAELHSVPRQFYPMQKLLPRFASRIAGERFEKPAALESEGETVAPSGGN